MSLDANGSALVKGKSESVYVSFEGDSKGTASQGWTPEYVNRTFGDSFDYVYSIITMMSTAS